jgi:hypothetical protein
MQIKIERSALLKHLRACKAIGCSIVRLSGIKGALRLVCVEPSISTAIPCACDGECDCMADEAGIKALIGVLTSIPDDLVELDVDARCIGIEAGRVHHEVCTFPEPEDDDQASLL